jgi:hypothetical protein
MPKRRTRSRRQITPKRVSRTRKMRGGAFSQNELQQLQTNGFSDYQIQILQERNIPFNDVMERINQLWNQGDDGFHGNSDDFAEQIMDQIINMQTPDVDFDAIPQAEDDIHDMDMSFNGDDDSLHLSDLNVTENSMRANTTVGDESFNNSQISDGLMSSLFSENESMESQNGGRRRRRRVSKKARKSKKRKSRKQKQKGGTGYGSGVGANNFDPNFSIYNTRTLDLFPYRAK